MRNYRNLCKINVHVCHVLKISFKYIFDCLKLKYGVLSALSKNKMFQDLRKLLKKLINKQLVCSFVFSDY